MEVNMFCLLLCWKLYVEIIAMRLPSSGAAPAPPPLPPPAAAPSGQPGNTDEIIEDMDVDNILGPPDTDYVAGNISSIFGYLPQNTKQNKQKCDFGTK